MSAFYVFGGILLLLVVVVVVSALREPAADAPDLEEADPEARRDAALEALREVEFDYRTGKLPEEEYRRLREAHGREAIRARDEAAAARAESAGRPGAEGPGEGLASPSAGSLASGEAEEPQACGVCGARLRPGTRFCARCGAPRTSPGGGSP